MNGLGRHILVEYYGCSSELLNDVIHIEKSMVDAAETAGATVINSTFHHFSPYGVSGVVVIQESHLAIHTWPEFGYAAVDLFTCGDAVNPWVSYKFLKAAFEAKHGAAIEMSRGQLDLLEKQDFDPTSMRERVMDHVNPSKYTRNVWFTDKDENIALSLRHTGDLLYKKQSDYQLVEVYNTHAYGKMLAIDHMVMTTEKDEFVYHEMIAHPAMFTHPNIKKVLVIGAGDGGTIRELLRHESVEKVVMVEIDGAVIEACKEHLPQIASQFDNPKLELHVADGIQYLKDAKDNSFDLIIIDSSDPVGPAEGLFSYDVFKDVYRCLTENGIMQAQSESPHFNVKTFQEIFKCYKSIFGNDKVHGYLAHIPTYPTGTWSFAYASKGNLHPVKDFNADKARDFSAKNKLKYYNEGVHVGAFALPTFVKEMIV